jgi:hypothetical protein
MIQTYLSMSHTDSYAYVTKINTRSTFFIGWRQNRIWRHVNFINRAQGNNIVFSNTLKVKAGVALYIVWLQTGRPGFDTCHRQRIFPQDSVYRPALRPTQPPIQWVPWGSFSGLKSGLGLTLTTHSHLASKSRMSKSCASSPTWRMHDGSLTVCVRGLR